jgi:hypothetical protein
MQSSQQVDERAVNHRSTRNVIAAALYTIPLVFALVVMLVVHV